MLKIFSTPFLNFLIVSLVVALVAKFLALIAWWYLPKQGVELKSQESIQPKYRRIVFNSMLEVQKNQKKVVKKKKSSGISITNMVLKGLYGTQQNGFAIVALKSNQKKTSLIGVGENFSGYTLVAINLNSVVFTKNKKDYVLEFIRAKNNLGTKRKKKITYSKAVEEELARPKEVSRGDIAYYAKNPRQIWRDISIREVKKHGKIYGFKIYNINSRSKFAKLGLQRGDIIIRANNVDLTSYKAAFDLYNHINEIDTMQLVILRDNEEKELVYEIH